MAGDAPTSPTVGNKEILQSWLLYHIGDDKSNMSDPLRDWRLDVEYMTGCFGESIPVGCKIYGGGDKEYFTRKYCLGKKFETKTGLNWKENSAIGKVCQLGADQVVQCYGPSDSGDGFSIYELSCYCEICPYALLKSKHFDRRNYSIWYPDYLEMWMESNLENDPTIEPDHYVYFVTDSQFVKIGKACKTNNRIPQLQTGNPRKISMLFRVWADSEKQAYALERYLHLVYEEYRMEGEWYDILGKMNIKAWKKAWFTDEEEEE